MTAHDPLSDQRFALIARIGRLWRGDWSGHVFDGRDSQEWLDCAMNGDSQDLADLAATLDGIERSYE